MKKATKAYRKTRVICTLGPSSSSNEMIQELIESGVDALRLNFSHGTYEEYSDLIKRIRRISLKLKRPVGILQDLQGPKIRIGKIVKEGIQLRKGDTFVISTDSCLGEKRRVSTTYQSLPNDVNIGDKILINDGLIEVVVDRINKNNVFCIVKVGGKLTSNKGLNLPGIELSTPAITEKDKKDIAFGLKHDIDFIALSFVRSVDDIYKLKKILSHSSREIPIVAKIEKPEALKNIEEIVSESYGIMVARGDLGVELKTEEVPVVQKKIVGLCNRNGKPVIIATQMLDSMIRNPRPTRAEASDVANAVLDGADALMLSGETANGKYPLESFKVMRRIIKSTEEAFLTKKSGIKINKIFELTSVSEAVSLSAVNIARDLDAKLIACVTHSGKTAVQIARFKSHLPVLAITSNLFVPRRMSLTWGVRSILIDKIENTERCFSEIERLLKKSEYLEHNDFVIFTAGMPTFEKNSTNMIKVHQIKRGKSKLF